MVVQRCPGAGTWVAGNLLVWSRVATLRVTQGSVTLAKAGKSGVATRFTLVYWRVCVERARYSSGYTRFIKLVV